MFKDSCINDLEVFFNDTEFAETAKYQGVDILVVEQEKTENITSVPSVIIPNLTVFVKVSDVPHPREGEILFYRGEEYQISSYPVREGNVWRLSLDGTISEQIAGL